ncbi:MAG: hypothetical protein B7Z72_07080 [Gemmatimonadetes bacterium 21-71-4]|nr:MAG: hypothetical protein B7Z72_07080 [Gemmatimonadetes bacterium 21-71-4]
MQEGLVHPFDQLLCSGSFKAYGQVFNNWDPLIHEYIDLPTALAMSCDTYFYELGRRFYVLPPDRGHPLQGWANRFGFGELSGVDLSPEVAGLVPTPEWRRKAYPASQGFGPIDRTWKPGYSIQLSIGQGQLLVTPLQMTRLFAMIANGGNLVTPHVAEDVELTGTNGQPARILRRFGAQPAQPTGVDPIALRYVQQGLEEATHASFGTGSGVFGNFPVNIAGKTGSAEKNITLQVALKLGAALKARGVHVVYTRTTDTLIALGDRGRIANQAGGDLFISIHVNAANPNWKDPGAARGYETYFLSEAKTEDARRVEKMENASVRFETGSSVARDDPLSFILSDMQQNEHLRESMKLADSVQAHLGGVEPGPSRGVKQAGFMVLVTAYMPAVLVEIGFGTNRQDAAFISDPARQSEIADSIADAAVDYLNAYWGSVQGVANRVNGGNP